MYPALFEKLVYPAYHRIRGWDINSIMKDVEDHFEAPLSKKLELQEEKLFRILEHCHQNVPYYRNLFSQRGITRNTLIKKFSDIPPLTKEIIRNNTNLLLQTDGRGKLIPNSTSGSTGEKLSFFQDVDSDYQRKAIKMVSLKRMGIRIGDKGALLWGAPMDQKKRKSLRGRMHRIITRHLFLSSYFLSEEVLAEYYRRLQSYRPTYLVSYPSPLDELAGYLRRNSIHLDSVKVVVTSAEALFPEQRRRIEDAFQCPLLDRYGCREFGDIAQQFQSSGNYLQFTNRVLLEILDEDLRPVPTGKEGRVYVTDLDNMGMPFIRYDIGDLSQWGGQGNGEESKWVTLRSFLGRTLECIRTRHDTVVGGTFWTILFRQRPGIRQFQVYQENLETIEIRYIPEDNDITEDDKIFFMKKIREVCGPVEVVFKKRKEIELTTSGKRKIIVSKLSMENQNNG
jgi:phenylacetate-CoA ligase